MDILKRISSFGRNNKLSNINLNEAYRLFQDSYSDQVPRKYFELGMLALNKAPAIRAKEACIKYCSVGGDRGYNKMIKELCYVTEDFWEKVTKNIKIDPEQLKDVPVEQSIEIKKPSPSEAEENKFEGLLPLNWGRMLHQERVDFAKKVQHKEFFEYLLGIDPKLKSFFDNVKKHNPENEKPFKLYITIMSFPSDTYSEESKKLLKGFIDILNQLGRARLQYMECTNPGIIEIRELRL